MSTWKFARAYAVPYLHWYLGGVAALVATNGLSVTIPLYLADGIDALALGPEHHATVVWDAAVVAAMGVLVIGIRTASRLLFFTPGRLVEAAIQRDLFAAILRQQPDFFAKIAPGDL